MDTLSGEDQKGETKKKRNKGVEKEDGGKAFLRKGEMKKKPSFF